jgi:hypothetical protein
LALLLIKNQSFIFRFILIRIILDHILQRLQKIRLAGIVWADEQVNFLQVERDVFQALEILDGYALQHNNGALVPTR